MKKDLVEDIKSRLSIEDVVGGYVELRRSGDSYKALSPFKAEKTPSLVVTPAKEIWKDFSSGKGGDLFNFVMEHEGVDFKEALNILAIKAGLNPDEYRAQRSASDAKRQDIKKTVLKVLKVTADFYAEQLNRSISAQRYVKERGFQAPVVKDFQIGYAPGDWQSLCKQLEAMKVPMRLAELAGLVKKRPIPQWLAQKEKTVASERWGDFFAGRIMIPLSDPQGQIIGFTGRLLSDKEGIAKYVNSKQTMLYSKSRHVFGYFQAKEAIRKEGFALVVEGNLDVVACHQAGYKQTVAAGGTALTVEHLRIIGRLTKDVRLAFDGDSAGTSAMERSLFSAQEAKVNLSIISLPEGCDPDDLIKKNLSLWKKIVHDYQPAPQWLYEKYKSQLDLQTAEGKKHLTDVMLPIIACLADEVEKDHYLKQLEQLDISRESLDKKMSELKATEKTRPPESPPPKRDTGVETEEFILPKQVGNEVLKVRLLLGAFLVEPKMREVLNEDQSEYLERFLENYKSEQKLYKLLLASTEPIDNPNKLSSDFKLVGESVKECLGAINAYENSLPQERNMNLMERMVNDLYRQLEILQQKAERSAPG